MIPGFLLEFMIEMIYDGTRYEGTGDVRRVVPTCEICGQLLESLIDFSVHTQCLTSHDLNNLTVLPL